MTTATLTMRENEIGMDLQCIALLSGLEVADLAPYEHTDFPLAVHRQVYRRRQECAAMTGVHEPDLLQTLLHFARLEGVEVVGVDLDGLRTVLVPATGAGGAT
ncbi:MAG: hypothetical protein CME34_13335 [Gordonia sp.]|uniref:hypothetical protein n=1 Tax=Gordonia sp. (in: high G+C Gram-positive bacteria) TaxID=84139 RepID=UPI000C518316|nr:hypothetical protein [Gordonia sp. (in: high G+C Gram-positive bacteria)]MAU82829.1 hypothetical protein [Gordonia sp. (in: high G+C Gram-positive bacteria)]